METNEMIKVRIAIVVVGILAICLVGYASKPPSDINAKLAQLDIDTATLEDVIRVFGEPEKYVWDKKTFAKGNLPSVYIAAYYSGGLHILMGSGKIHELRFQGPRTRYVYKGKLRVGSSLDEVLNVVGRPTETIEGAPSKWTDGVLYKDIDGRKGSCYYGRADQNVRFFFANYKVTGLYVTVTRSDSRTTSSGSFTTVRPIESVEEFGDVRFKDMSKLDLSDRPNIIRTLTFNQKTVWPTTAKMRGNTDPKKALKGAMNPGLGIRKLHKEGITGRGVNVAIIDQPMHLDHPEFAGKIAAYHDVGCGGSQSSMHGPAVASLLVGTNCGTAPGARVYYAAAPSWTKDTAYYAKALDWIIEQNKLLGASAKIRVVSVSAAPSGPGSPFEKNQQMWDEACARAEEAGMLVLDCTTHRGFIDACWYDASNPDNVPKCTPGYPGRTAPTRPGCILVPSSPRTTAEQYHKGEFAYQYCGRGGLSWTIPYCAGVLALGWEVNPDLSPQQIRDLLFRSAYVNKTGQRIINPRQFIRFVKKTVASPRTKTHKS